MPDNTQRNIEAAVKAALDGAVRDQAEFVFAEAFKKYTASTAELEMRLKQADVNRIAPMPPAIAAFAANTSRLLPLPNGDVLNEAVHMNQQYGIDIDIAEEWIMAYGAPAVYRAIAQAQQFDIPIRNALALVVLGASITSSFEDLARAFETVVMAFDRFQPLLNTAFNAAYRDMRALERENRRATHRRITRRNRKRRKASPDRKG